MTQAAAARPAGRHHMSALLRLLSAGEDSAAGSDSASAAAPSIVSAAPCLEMTCTRARHEVHTRVYKCHTDVC